MVLRQIGSSLIQFCSPHLLASAEKKLNIKESVIRAKESVSLDLSDGNSWCRKIYASNRITREDDGRRN